MNDAQLNIAVCDDEAYMREMICKELEKQFAKRKINIHITEYDAGEGLLEADSLFDIIFLDIEMPGLDGMQTARKIREGNSYTKIVFLTSHIEPVRTAYQVGAHRYLIKDSYLDEIEECIDSIIEADGQFVSYSVVHEGIPVEIKEKDILYISSRHNGTEVWLDNFVGLSDKSLGEWEKILSSSLFARVHTGYIVNVSHIDFIDEKIVLYSGEKIAFSRRKKSEIKEKYTKYMCKGGR